MPAHRALPEESADSVLETAAPRRALMPGISQTAILTSGYCSPRRAFVEVPAAPVARAVTKPRSRRSRFVMPAAAVLLTSAFGLGVSLAPQASAAQSRPANTAVGTAVSSSTALAPSGSTAGSGADVMNSSVGAISAATAARLANEAAQQTEQASQQEQRATALAAVGKTAADKLSADAKASADKAAADKAAADKAAADKAAAQAAAASQRTGTQQKAASQVASAATSSASTSSSATTSSSTATTRTGAATAAASSTSASSSAAQAAMSYALAQVGKPYSWGASGPDSFDCSGLMQAAYASAGISLPRTTYAQVSAGTPVSTSALQPGDLVFFYGNEHVGMYIGNGKVVHAADYGIGVIISDLSSMTASAATRVA